MSGRETHAVVAIPALDLRPEPGQRAELASQLLLGETVKLLAPARAGWRRVENEADGYRGWVREWGLVPASATRVARWRRRATTVVYEPFASVRTARGGATVVSPLFLGSRVIAGPRVRGWRAVELPDGRRGFLPATALRLDRERPVSLLDRIRTLFGTPYLWGGRTPAGFDCSGFVQQVLQEQGVTLPRDARDQSRVCRRLRATDRAREGDLAFFAAAGEAISHVGIALGENYYVHSRGIVRVASLDRDNPLCDNALAGQFQGWFRPGFGPRSRPGPRPGSRRAT